MKFEDIPGQEGLKKSLVQAAASGQVAHAQLFTGPEGGVAFMVALAYAQYLNCENQTENDSCGSCAACIKISRFIHPDVHFCFPWAKTELISEKEEDFRALLPAYRNFLTDMPFGRLSDWAEKAEFNNRTPIINIRTVRDTMQGLHMKAYEGRYKIQLIWLPETMRNEGSNAFLKLLEEPPPFTLFFLVSTQPELLLPTIISRTQRVTVARLADAELAAYLVKKYGIEERKAAAIASLSEGNIAESLQLLDEKDDDYHHLFLEWQRACYRNNTDKLIEFTNAFVELGKELQKSYIRFSLGKIRSALVLAYGAPTVAHLPENEAAELGLFGKIFTLPLLQFLMEELEQAWYQIDRNASGRMVFLDLSLRLAQAYSRLDARSSN